MKLAFALASGAAIIISTAQASWFGGTGFHAIRGHQGCAFSIESEGSFTCPAGQLSDGQIRLNGTEQTSTFYIDSGGITDSSGFGCIVTEPPTTQIQCDEGKPPSPGFSIDSSDKILYKGSSVFFACPATDTVYNIYVNPDFGQTTCFQVALRASGCGAAPTCPPPSTLWQTQTILENTTSTVTVTATSSELCPSSSSYVPTSTPAWSNSTTACRHCTKIKGQ
ncbi:hypothetical protein BKA65DRAFT_28151 [Rhexocercosporidium sp. MPI-PUGE-AT-0058]|nr:hypothetical protein BKA65DRAFT_28151 [Rhexocercosporidium sp. MPI-PUGE-AT-0058]